MEKDNNCNLDNGNSNTIIPVMHCFDNNYVIPAAVSFYSMLENADAKYEYKLYVLHSDITQQNRVKLTQVVQKFPNASIEFVNMSNKFNDIWQDLKFSGHYSKEVLYKLLIASIFPQYDKMIVTDVDVAFLGDIAPSYFSFDANEDILFAGVRQIMPKNTWLEGYYKNYIQHFGKNSLSYLKICGGYLVANLKQIRDRNVEEKFIEFLKENVYRLLQSEQDVINFCTKENDIRYLSLNHVVCSYEYDIFEDKNNLDTDPFYTKEQIDDSMRNPIQLHYATGIKPWKDYGSTKADIWFSYLSKTGMYFDFINKENALKKEAPVFISNSDIRKSVEENISPMIVSVLCCTYNHEKFIKQTLESLVNQQVDFPYEIIVADDASTDGTQEIIKAFQIKYPHLIKPILREKNVGIGANYYDALTKVSGRYLAICDGDDTWIDMFKIQKQVDFLNKNLDYNICCSSCIRHSVTTGEENLFNPEEYLTGVIGKKEYYTFKDLLNCRFIASCTVMMRWQLRNNLPLFIKEHNVIDFPLILIHSAGGKIKVMGDEVFSQYNVHEKGITSSNADDVQQETFIIINEVNQFLDYRFTKIVNEYMESYKQYMLQLHKSKASRVMEKALRQNTEKLGKIMKRFAPQNSEEESAGYEADSKMVSEELVDVGNTDNSLEMFEEKKVEKKANIFIRLFRRIIWLACLLYSEFVPEILKRVWRIIKKALIFIYNEFVPNVIKRAYRRVKRLFIR